MNTLQKSPNSPIDHRLAHWAPTDDLAGLDQIVRIAIDDPRLAASQLAYWLDCNTTHHEGSDGARVLDDWAYDPCKDSLDVLAWYARNSKDRLPVRLTMMAIIAGAVAMMADDPPTSNWAAKDSASSRET
jgi:hypothetical protein